MILGSIFTTERGRDKDAVIGDLQAELRRTQAKLYNEQFKRSCAEAHCEVLRDQLNKPKRVPLYDDTFGYECSNPKCFEQLIPDYEFCPGCGCEIDWRGDDDSDWR